MNFQQIEYILAVDRLKSFTKASEYCNVTQATLSAMVKKLEEELGVIIFDRKQNPIITTDIGLQLLQEANSIKEHVMLLKEIANNKKTNIEGHIKIGIIPTIANSLLPQIIRPIIEKYPDLHVEIIELTTQHITKQLKEGTIDVGIVATPTHNTDMEEKLLYYESLLVYGKMNNDKKYIVPDEIKNHKIWLLEEGHCLREQFLNLCALKKNEVIPNNLSFEANSFETLLSLVDEFGGLTIIPELYVPYISTDRKKKINFFSNPMPVREISLIYFRPYAKKHIIDALGELIKIVIVKKLLSKNVIKKDLSIINI